MTTSSGNAAFEQLIDSILTSYYDAHPSTARWLGLHQYDARITDHSDLARSARVRELDMQILALDQVDANSVHADQRHDRDLIRSLLTYERFQLSELDEWRRSPMAWTDDVDLSGYLIRSYAPIDTRAQALGEHARAIPAFLAQAQSVLEPKLARPIVETAIDVFAGVASFLRTDVPAALAEGQATVDISQEIEQAARAIDQFVAFLHERLADAHDDYAIGAERFSAMLAHGELVDHPLDHLLALGEEDLKRNLKLARETAATIDPGQDVRAVFAQLAARHPESNELVPTIQSLLEELRQFVLDRQIVSVPSEARCLVRETPGYLRWAFAMLDPAGPLEDDSMESYYYVTPPEADWPMERQEQWLTNFDFASLPGLSAHEAYPGHFVHFLHIRGAGSTARKVVLAYSFIEGWAHYVEEMMLDEGYGGGDPRLRLPQLREALIRNCRYIVALRMHLHGMTVDDATRFFMENSFTEEGPARQEAVRGTFDPGYLNYTLGKLMMRKLRSDYEREQVEAFSLREFHDRLLSLGAPPFPLARRALLTRDVEQVL